jgi:hypothetical protein
VGRRSLTISGAVAIDRFYDGTTAATVDFTGAGLGGVIGGDAVTIDSSAYSASFASASIGTDTSVTVDGVTLGGAGAGNYTVDQPSGLSADIAPASTLVASETAPLHGAMSWATCYYPFGTATGDIVFSLIQAQDKSGPVPPVYPTGGSWTKIGDYSYTTSIAGTTHYFSYALYYEQMGATWPLSNRWDFSRVVDTISVTNVTYRGATYDTASAVPYTTADTSLTAGSVAPAAAGELLLVVGGAHDPAGTGTVSVSTAPTGFTANVDVFSNDFMGYFALATHPQASAAASGTQTATLNMSTDLKQAWLIALKP